MRTALAFVFASLTSMAFVAPAAAESPGEAARRLREAAQFDHARAEEFRKLANEDDGVAQGRARQAQDLDNNAIKYSQRAQYHRAIAAQFGNNPDQLRLARECDQLATEMHNMANERRNIVRLLQGHVGQWRNWANALDARAASEQQAADSLANAGRL
jgi:hypothetical protein